MRLATWITKTANLRAKITMTKSTAGAIENAELPATSNTGLSLKKPYETPCLKVYGTIGAMTRAVGMGTLNDGWKHKTH